MANLGGIDPLAAGLKDQCHHHQALRSGSVVSQHGFDPCFLAYRASVLATRRQGGMVRLAGDDPAASAMSRRRSTAELKTQLVLPDGLEPPNDRV